MREYILLFYDLFLLIMALYGVYFGAVSLGFLLKKRPAPPPEGHLRFAVLIAARNEEECIAGIVESIKGQDYPSGLADVYVIPNNCTDRTEEAAMQAGAKIIRVSPSVCSKGQALHEAFAHLLKTEKHDAYCVFDADNEANPSFLSHMNAALSSGARAAKSRILAKNPHEGILCACYETYFCNANLFLNCARHKLNLSSRLIGTGFAVRRDLMEELDGWNTTSLTEDAEFYAALSARGEQIIFVPGAVTYDEQPLTVRESLIQRRRWMSGVMGVTGQKFSALLQGCVGKKGRRFSFDALMQLSFAFVQAWVIPIFLLRLCADPVGTLTALPGGVLRFYLSTLLLGAVSLLLERRLNLRTAPALPLYPLFIFSFLPLQTLSLFCPNKKWVPIRHRGVRIYGVPAK